MKEKTEGINLLRNIFRAFLPVLITLWLCGMLLSYALNSISPSGQRTPRVPAIILSNVGPCLDFNGKRVDKFREGDSQWICADMEADETEANLNLYILKSENKVQVYLDRIAFNNGPIAFPLKPLAEGKYWARITWARTTLIEFEFEVIK